MYMRRVRSAKRVQDAAELMRSARDDGMDVNLDVMGDEAGFEDTTGVVEVENEDEIVVEGMVLQIRPAKEGPFLVVSYIGGSAKRFDSKSLCRRKIP
jgi:hypothetical protein